MGIGLGLEVLGKQIFRPRYKTSLSYKAKKRRSQQPYLQQFVLLAFILHISLISQYLMFCYFVVTWPRGSWTYEVTHRH